MKDINFFLPYLDKRKVKFNNKFFMLVLFLIFVLSVSGYTIFNQLRINKLTEGARELETYAKNPKTLKQVESIRKEEEDLNKFKAEVETIRELKDQVESKDIISSTYINTIITKKPSDLFLTNIFINPESMSISGISNNKMSIAEFGKGLQNIEDFKDVFISNITRNEADYTFDLERTLVEEVEDGTIQEETPEETEEPKEE